MPAPAPDDGPRRGPDNGPQAGADEPCSTEPGPPEQVPAGPVLLRRIQIEDSYAIAAAVSASMEHLKPWMPWVGADAADPRSQVARAAEAEELWESGTDYIYSVLAGEDQDLAGQIGLHRRNGEGGVEIGYWITAAHAGRGFGTAATRAMTAVAMALPGVSRVEIHCDEANAASAAIPRKLGYRLDRIEMREPEAPGESGRLMVWVRDRDRAAVGSPAGDAW